MSTYTNLHNRVQESINVDYVTRKTPQKVILRNEENEYYGTFHGQVDIENIDVNGGTISGVTIQDAVLSGVKLCAVEGLNIDLGEYVKQDEIDELTSRFDELDHTASQAAQDATSALISARSTLDSIAAYKTSIDSRIDSVYDTVNNIDTALTNSIGSQLEQTKNEVQTLVDSLRNEITGPYGVNERLDAKDTVVAREAAINSLRSELETNYKAADSILSGNLTGVMQTVSTDITTLIHREEDGRIRDDALLCTEITNTLCNAITSETYTRQQEDERVLQNARLSIDDEITARRFDDSVLCAAITDEITARQFDTAFLSGAISSEITARQADDTFLSDAITGEIANREAAITQLNNSLTDIINNVSSDITVSLEGETYQRTQEDANINSLIISLSSTSKLSDNNIIDNIGDVSSTLNSEIDSTKEFLLNTIEHDRHYVIQTGKANTCPLKADDMAVNVFDINLPDGRLIYQDPIEGAIPVAQVNILNANPLRLNVKTYNGITNKNIVSALVQNTNFVFSDDKTTNYMEGKNYELKYEAGNTWKESRFWLDPVANEFFNIKYGEQVIGKVYDAELAYDEHNQLTGIISGKYSFDMNDSILSVFNKFSRLPFEYGTELSVQNIAPDRITYDGVSFKLERNLDSRMFISLVDATPGATGAEFGRIYDHIGFGLEAENEHGIDYDDGEISKIRVVSQLPYHLTGSYTVNLRRNQNFVGLLTSDINDVQTGKTYNYYLSADVNGTSAKFTAYKAAKMYKYEFSYRDFETENDEEKISYITPKLYNRTIAEAGTNFPTADVDLTNAPIYRAFKKNYTLYKTDSAGEWTWSESNPDGSSITIKYNIVKLTITEITPNQQVVARHEYNVGSNPIESSDSTVYPLYETDVINLGEGYPETAGVAEGTYQASIDLVPNTAAAVQHDLVFDTLNCGKIDIEVPDKTDSSLNDQISREFMTVIRLKNNNQTEYADEEVEINFINSLGQDVKVYNGTSTEYYLAKNKWTTLQLNEIRPNIFLLNDIDQNSDKAKFSFLCGVIGDLDTKIDTTNEQLSVELSGALSDSLRFKGDVRLKADYDEHETHNHMSALLSTCAGFAADTSLKRGFTFRCAAAGQTSAEITENGIDKLSVDENDYLILKRDCILSDTTIADVEIIKDFSHQIERLSTTSDEKYFILSANNTATGSNIFTNANIEVLSARNEQVNSLSADTVSATILTVDGNVKVDNTGISANALSVNETLGVANKLTATAEGLTIDGILTATDSTATGLTVENILTADSTSVKAANKLEAQTISANSGLTAATIDAGIINASTRIEAQLLSATNSNITNLSVDNISATSTLSAANANIMVLSGNIVSANSLTAVDLSSKTNNIVSAKAEFLSADNISATDATIQSAYISALSVPTFEKIFDVATTSSLADNISTLTSDINRLNNGLTTVVSAVNGALLSNQTITETQPVTQGHNQRTMVVSKLVLVDEVNFNKYTLTIRNGALNIDKITA